MYVYEEHFSNFWRYYSLESKKNHKKNNIRQSTIVLVPKVNTWYRHSEDDQSGVCLFVLLLEMKAYIIASITVWSPSSPHSLSSYLEIFNSINELLCHCFQANSIKWSSSKRKAKLTLFREGSGCWSVTPCVRARDCGCASLCKSVGSLLCIFEYREGYILFMKPVMTIA